jgi:hypothetical protein
LTHIKIQQMTYNIGHIPKGLRDSPDARREVILAVIQLNPRISQNHLLEIVAVHLEAMAKLTFERHIHALAREKLVYVIEHERKKLYSTFQVNDSYLMSDILNRLLLEVEGHLPELKKHFSRYSRIKQNTVVIHMLKALRDIDACLMLCERSKMILDVEEQKARRDELYEQAFGLAAALPKKSLTPDSQWQFLFTALHNDAFVSTRTLTNFIDKPDSEYVRR